MARPSVKLIEALKNTAKRIENGEKYMWGHMGACNCGHLAQELTSYSQSEIHSFALKGVGDWSEQAQAFCGSTSLPLDFIIADLLKEGLTVEDLMHLERLSDKEVLQLIPQQRREMIKHNKKQDVVHYLNTWAQLLESKLLAKINIERAMNSRSEEVPALKQYI